MPWLWVDARLIQSSVSGTTAVDQSAVGELWNDCLWSCTYSEVLAWVLWTSLLLVSIFLADFSASFLSAFSSGFITLLAFDQVMKYGSIILFFRYSSAAEEWEVQNYRSPERCLVLISSVFLLLVVPLLVPQSDLQGISSFWQLIVSLS